MSIARVSHRATDAAKALRQCVSTAAPFNVLVEAARNLVKRADEMESVLSDKPVSAPHLAPCTIALSEDGEALAITVPGTTGRQHTFQVGLDLQGLVAVYDVLRARARYREERSLPNIGTVAAPIQHLVDEFMRKGGRIEDDATRSDRKLREQFGDEVANLELDIEI